MALELTEARFPFPSGGYESYYLTAHHPSEPLAIWIRSTVTQSPQGRPVGQKWLTFFHETGVAKLREIAPASTERGWIQIGDAVFADGSVGGSIENSSWDLHFTPQEEPFLYLPSERMYRAPLPKTKPVSLSPHIRVDGTLRIGERSIAVEAWRGMVGHNWGTEHAESWIWLHGIFDHRTWIDVVLARVKLGPVRTPWIANGAVCVDGVRHRLGGLTKGRATKVATSSTGASIELAGDGLHVHAEVQASVSHTALWDYKHPKGGQSDVRNCSVSDLEIACTFGTGAPLRFRLSGAAEYEIGTSSE